MPDAKAFRHQDYWSVPNADSYEQLIPRAPLAPGSDEFVTEMTNVKSAFDRAGVRRIVLVHGTLAGTDALGWYGHWQRVLPGLSEKLKHAYKSIVDKISHDRGNYTLTYAEQLVRGLNADDASPRIEVERFEWTSENHHLGRADAAVRLADQLLNYEADGESVLLCGHSHAGNVFALVTHLLGNKPRSQPDLIEQFFSVSRHFNRSTQRIDLEAWNRLESRLVKRAEVHSRRKTETCSLDFVTFGTPVRYGWDESGYDHLLHFVNHHAVEHLEPFRSVWPQTRNELMAAIKGEYGDFVQQTFVARSDFTPAIWSWYAWKGNRILRNLLEASELETKRLERLRQGVRVADSGFTLLVDYGAVDPTAKEICGHGVYTEPSWMSFHLNEITARFYGR